MDYRLNEFGVVLRIVVTWFYVLNCDWSRWDSFIIKLFNILKQLGAHFETLLIVFQCNIFQSFYLFNLERSSKCSILMIYNELCIFNNLTISSNVPSCIPLLAQTCLGPLLHVWANVEEWPPPEGWRCVCQKSSVHNWVSTFRPPGQQCWPLDSAVVCLSDSSPLPLLAQRLKPGPL